MCIGFLLLWFQDPLTNYFQPWVTYNTNLVNVGNRVQAIPGWQSFNAPGRQIPEPLLFTPEVYVLLWLGLAMLGTVVIASARPEHAAGYARSR